MGVNLKQSYYQHYHNKGIERVENDVGQMVPKGIQTPDGIIQGMGYPGQRVPVACMEIKKGPPEKSRIQRAYTKILINIKIVVPLNELILKGAEIDNKCYDGNCSCKIEFKMLPYHLAEAFSPRYERSLTP